MFFLVWAGYLPVLYDMFLFDFVCLLSSVIVFWLNQQKTMRGRKEMSISCSHVSTLTNFWDDSVFLH